MLAAEYPALAAAGGLRPQPPRTILITLNESPASMPNPRPPVVLATVLAALACAGESYLTGPLPPDGPTNIEVTTDRSSYDIGGAASVTLRNASADTVLYGACADVLEKRLYDGRWVALSPPPQNCPDIAFLLGAGESRVPFPST